MDSIVQTLQDILINTYNPDTQLRQVAESALASFLNTDGSFRVLVHLAGKTDVHRDLRQAAAIVAKNNTRKFWSDEASVKYPSKVVVICNHEF